MRIGERVELRAGSRLCPRCGEIVAVIEQHGRVTSLRVRMDGSGRVVTVDPSKVETV